MVRGGGAILTSALGLSLRCLCLVRDLCEAWLRSLKTVLAALGVLLAALLVLGPPCVWRHGEVRLRLVAGLGREGGMGLTRGAARVSRWTGVRLTAMAARRVSPQAEVALQGLLIVALEAQCYVTCLHPSSTGVARAVASVLLSVTYLWALSHAAWNAFIHALVGNGMPATRGGSKGGGGKGR